ncbi:MAG: FKBP-type peptidyl-prolyl cis-trans isomerase [Puniceicoccales bacterium]|nr:FKBP-type peptidyl-prolyl cis-trans isomerase [Puniceicoccales bacterium]
MSGFSLHVLATSAAHTSPALPAKDAPLPKDAVPASSPAAGASSPAPAGPQSAANQKAQRARYLRGLGHILVINGGLINFGFDREEIGIICDGVLAALNGEANPINPEDIGNLQELLQQQDKNQSDKNKEEGMKFIEAKKTEGGWIQSNPGLIHKVITPGDGVRVTPDSTVRITYTGRFSNGKVFDSTDKPTQAYVGSVIPGVHEGMKQIGQGGKVCVIFSSEYGYGDASTGPIPGGSTLVFDIEIHEINHPTLGKEEPKDSKEAPKGKEEPKPDAKATTAK